MRPLVNMFCGIVEDDAAGPRPSARSTRAVVEAVRRRGIRRRTIALVPSQVASAAVTRPRHRCWCNQTLVAVQAAVA
jgi:hypothetical protein